VTKLVRASAVGTAKGPRKSSQHGCLIGSESNRPHTTPQVHIEAAAAKLGITPFWLRLRLRLVGDYVSRDQLRALGKRDREAPLRGQAWQRHWRSRNYAPDVVRRDDLLLPGGIHVAAAERALHDRLCALRKLRDDDRTIGLFPNASAAVAAISERAIADV
jgi:hypothetical protein